MKNKILSYFIKMNFLTPRVIYALHAFFIAPLIAYVGYQKGRVDPRLYDLLVILGIVAILYHGSRLYSLQNR